MKKIKLIVFLLFTIIIAYGKTDKDVRIAEYNVAKDYDLDGIYSSYEKALRRVQERIYVALPEKRGYWYTMLDKIKSEETELYNDEEARMKKSKTGGKNE